MSAHSDPRTCQPKTIFVIAVVMLSLVGLFVATPSQVAAQDVVASAGNDVRVEEGSLVMLNGSASSPADEIVSYTWNFTYDGEELTFNGAVVYFTFDIPGTYVATLTVVGPNNTDSDECRVVVDDVPSWLESNAGGIVLYSIVGIVAAWLVLTVLRKYRRDKTLLTPSDMEKLKVQWKGFKKTMRIFKANRLGFGGMIILVIFVIMAVFAPWIVTVSDPNYNMEPNVLVDDWKNPLPPSFTPSPYTDLVHPWGTDHKGRDIYSMTVYGSRASLMVGLVATLISVVLGASIGLAAGFFGKATDEVLMRLTDFFLVLPWFPLMIVLMAILGREFIWIILTIGLTSWPSTARIVRSQVLTIKERQFIERARAVGADSTHIIAKHIMPNVMPLIFANTVLLISLAIFSESFLDFFGLGDPTVISWGTMLEAAYDKAAFSKGAWWWITAPGGAIVIMVLAFSMVGYALDDVLNPKLRKR